MKLSELIATVGDDNIVFQTLKTDIKKCNIFSDGSSAITFNTSPEIVKDMMVQNPMYVGFVIWIPSELMPKIDKVMSSTDE